MCYYRKYMHRNPNNKIETVFGNVSNMSLCPSWAFRKMHYGKFWQKKWIIYQANALVLYKLLDCPRYYQKYDSEANILSISFWQSNNTTLHCYSYTYWYSHGRFDLILFHWHSKTISNVVTFSSTKPYLYDIPTILIVNLWRFVKSNSQYFLKRI